MKRIKGVYSMVQSERNKRGRFWRLIGVFVLINMLLPVFSTTVYADLGPKPSVIITTEDLPESICYGTLLASEESSARWHAVDEPIGNERGEVYARAYNAFLEYSKQDNYFFWGNIFKIDNGSFSWSYRPPDRFKVLLYDMDKDILYVGGETERYAFDSIYKASIHSDGTVSLSKASYILENILNFCIRLVFTVMVELLIALLFGYRKKKEILLVVVVNLITQFGLNLFLAFSDRLMSYSMVWSAMFAFLEFIIFIGEAIVYMCCLKSHSRIRAVVYALSANLLTLLSGALILYLS